MLKNVVVIEKSPSMPSRNHLLHDFSVRDGSLTLRTWFCQAEGISQPRNGIANGNIHGLDLAPRLDGLVFSPRAKLIVPWEPETMVFGSLHYLCTKYDGSPAHPPFGDQPRRGRRLGSSQPSDWYGPYRHAENA